MLNDCSAQQWWLGNDVKRAGWGNIASEIQHMVVCLSRLLYHHFYLVQLVTKF